MWEQMGRLLRWPNFYAAMALILGGKLAYALYLGDWERAVAPSLVLVVLGITFLVMCRPFAAKTGAPRREDTGHDT